MAIKKRAENSSRKHQEVSLKTSPKKKKQYYLDVEEAKQKLQHCIEDGLSKANKIRIEDFLYIKDLKPEQHVNELLIQQLAIFSTQNIILRYLLLEAALNNDKIESILRKQNLFDGNKFYSLPNNPLEFYSKPYCYIPENERLSFNFLNFKLFSFGILTPEEASKKKIVEKTNVIMDEEIHSFIKDFSNSFANDIQVMLKQNSEKKITPSVFYENIKFIFKYMLHAEIENQFLNKYKHTQEGFIIFLNEMYWFDENKFKSFINTYLYFPKLIMSIAKNTNQVFLSLVKFTNEEIPELKREIKRKEKELEENIKHSNREKALLHAELDKENSEDRRKPKRNCEAYIKEYLSTVDYNKRLTKEALAPKIKDWIKNKYHINFSTSTIRPKLSKLL